MLSRLVVAAVAIVATLAALDTLRGRSEPSAPAAAPGPEAPYRAPGFRRLVERAPGHHFRADGGRLGRRVVIGGREYLGHATIEAAFPGRGAGWINVSRIELAPDGTLVLALHRFEPSGRVVSALQLWRARRLVSAFRVPPGSFSGGLGFGRGRDGIVIATFAADGRQALYDRRGRRVAPTVLGTRCRSVTSLCPKRP
jgi:hypothetical protein